MNDEEITTRLVRIETKLDGTLEGRADHEARLRSLEKEQWIHRGGLAVVAILTTLVAKLGLPWFHG